MADFFDTAHDPGQERYPSGVSPVGTSGSSGIIVDRHKFIQHNFDKRQGLDQVPFSYGAPAPFKLVGRDQAYVVNVGTDLDRVLTDLDEV